MKAVYSLCEDMLEEVKQVSRHILTAILANHIKDLVLLSSKWF